MYSMSRALKVTPLPPFPFNGKAMQTEEYRRKKKPENMYNGKNSRRSEEKRKYLEFIGIVKTWLVRFNLSSNAKYISMYMRMWKRRTTTTTIHKPNSGKKCEKNKITLVYSIWRAEKIKTNKNRTMSLVTFIRWIDGFHKLCLFLFFFSHFNATKPTEHATNIN